MLSRLGRRAGGKWLPCIPVAATLGLRQTTLLAGRRVVASVSMLVPSVGVLLPWRECGRLIRQVQKQLAVICHRN
jgi:hypothetical protein